MPRRRLPRPYRFKVRVPSLPMGKSAYQKGYNTEREARRILEANGYYVVRAGGSKGVWDLLAVPTSKLPSQIFARLIQVKLGRWPCSDELDRLINAANGIHARCEVWMKKKNPRGTRTILWLRRELPAWGSPLDFRMQGGILVPGDSIETPFPDPKAQ